MRAQPQEPAPIPAQDGAPNAALLAQLADVLSWPLLLLRPDGQLLHANLAARQLLQQGRLLRLDAARRLTVWPERRQAGWETALAGAATQAAPALLRWPGAASHDSYTATLTWLAPLRRDQPPCVLLALASEDSRKAELLAFGRLHALSAAEMRVLQRLARGDSSVSAAAALGVSPSTVRSQILRLRRKTGHASVAELLHSLARMPPVLPLAGPAGDGE